MKDDNSNIHLLNNTDILTDGERRSSVIRSQNVTWKANASKDENGNKNGRSYIKSERGIGISGLKFEKSILDKFDTQKIY